MVRNLEKLVNNYKPKTYPLSYIGDICLQVTFKTRGDGNFLYMAVSLAISGSKEYYIKLKTLDYSFHLLMFMHSFIKRFISFNI